MPRPGNKLLRSYSQSSYAESRALVFALQPLGQCRSSVLAFFCAVSPSSPAWQWLRTFESSGQEYTCTRAKRLIDALQTFRFGRSARESRVIGTFTFSLVLVVMSAIPQTLNQSTHKNCRFFAFMLVPMIVFVLVSVT